MAIQNYSDNILLVELPPEPDTRAELDKIMDTIRHKPHCDVIVDFAAVDILKSLSLSGCLQLHELLKASGRRLIFSNVAPLTKGIFNVTCFDGIFEFINDKEQALQLLQPAKK